MKTITVCMRIFLLSFDLISNFNYPKKRNNEALAFLDIAAIFSGKRKLKVNYQVEKCMLFAYKQ